ncbi:MAG TPA: DUF488 domain-containing protein [Pirellulales bacterium]|nr:DUF488 domain-containing protein [Pirellulales bacterium]
MSSATAPMQANITLFTIGFTGKSAREFFERLERSGVRRLVDTRLNNVSQLAGFTKKRDLEYFLRAIADIDYTHDPGLAPTKDLLDDYKKKRIDWDEYARRFDELLRSRRPAERLTLDELDGACLLCSEPTPENCHRRLVAEYLKEEWTHVTIEHL